MFKRNVLSDLFNRIKLALLIFTIGMTPIFTLAYVQPAYAAGYVKVPKKLVIEEANEALENGADADDQNLADNDGDETFVAANETEVDADADDAYLNENESIYYSQSGVDGDDTVLNRNGVYVTHLDRDDRLLPNNSLGQLRNMGCFTDQSVQGYHIVNLTSARRRSSVIFTIDLMNSAGNSIVVTCQARSRNVVLTGRGNIRMYP
jgi:hypothetical protein